MSILLTSNDARSDQRETWGGEPPGTSCEIVFQLDHPSAKEVLLIGSFTNWDEEPMPMQRDETGSWRTCRVLPPGVHFYRFLADGEWQHDPHAMGWRRSASGVPDNMLRID